MKTFYYGSALLLLLLTGFYFFYENKIKGEIEQIETPTTPIFPESSDQLSIRGRDNQTLYVRNFLEDISTKRLEGSLAEAYLFDEIDSDKKYQIYYYAEDDSFAIILTREPISQARTEAEQELLAKLGIMSNDACRLNIRVRVPDFLESKSSGENLGLSFCPGSIQL